MQSLDSDFQPDGLFDCERINGQPGDPSHCHPTLLVLPEGFLAIRITPGVGNLACYQGACAPDTRQLLVPVSVDTLIAVRFDPMPVDLTVHKAGSGTGHIVGTQGDIDCGKVCTVTLEYGAPGAALGHRRPRVEVRPLDRCVAGQPKDCLISLIADTDTTARFVLKSASASNPPGPTPMPTLRVDPSVAPSSPGASGSPRASSGSATGAPTPSPGPTPVSTTGGGEPSLLGLVLVGGGAGVLVGLLVYQLLSSRRASTAPDETQG